MVTRSLSIVLAEGSPHNATLVRMPPNEPGGAD
jgi:hypothetical protein